MMNMHAATELLFGDAADLTSKLVPLSRTARLYFPVRTTPISAPLLELNREIRFRLNPRLSTLLVAVVEADIEAPKPIRHVDVFRAVLTTDI